MTSQEKGFCVKVLAEELAYNKSLKQFKMFIIEKPLDPDYKASVVYWWFCSHSNMGVAWFIGA